MYKVFVNDKPLFLTNTIEKETDFKVFLLESVDIHQLIEKYFQNKIQKAYLYHPEQKMILKTLKSKLEVQKAGGGLVYNDLGQVLFIYRNGKWDLPKGGIEKNETIEEAAMREVTEETGVRQLHILEKLPKTYHVFKRNGSFKLKVTHWFKMQSKHSGELMGQAEEGIERVSWLNAHEIECALQNSYENIKLLFQTE